MLDRKFIREQADRLQEVAKQKRIDISIENLLNWDDERLSLLAKVEELRQVRNTLSEQIARKLKEGDHQTAETMKDQVRQMQTDISRSEGDLAAAEREWQRLMLLVPNVVSPDTPIGDSDKDNVEVRRIGTPPAFAFEPSDHITIGERLGLIDIERGVKVGGTRNYYLKGAGYHLHRAVQQLAIDMLVERQFTIMEVPMIVREEAMLNTGFFPLGRDQSYALSEGNKWLVGTSEVPLVSYYGGEIVDVREPIRLAGVSASFRSEIGSAGRDVRGLYRVHQFAKVEQVVLCGNDPNAAEAILREITRNAEDLLELLELPYRVVAVCTGDMSQKNYKQFDIETWMPSRLAYCETHSSSYLTDFQARRSNIRYRDENGKLQFCHTLNNTAVASPRILIPLLENHQQEDGTVHIPKALCKYMYGMEELRL